MGTEHDTVTRGRDPYAPLRSMFVHGNRDSLWVVAAVTAASVVLGFAAGSLFVSRVVPFFAGWDVTAVAGASMSPLINTGDVIAYEAIDPSDVSPGNVIVFDDPARPGGTVTHRVVSVTDDGDFVTKGDANATEDSSAIPAESLRGRATMVVPFAGFPTVWFDQGEYLPLAILVAILLGAGFSALPHRRDVDWARLRRRHTPSDEQVIIDLTERLESKPTVLEELAA